MGILWEVAKRPKRSVGITNVFLWLFSIALSKRIKSEGNTLNVQIKLQITPLASTTPMSIPMRKRMKQSISKPTTVVIAELMTGRYALLMAKFTASIGSGCDFFFWRYLFVRIMQ